MGETILLEEMLRKHPPKKWNNDINEANIIIIISRTIGMNTEGHQQSG